MSRECAHAVLFKGQCAHCLAVIEEPVEASASKAATHQAVVVGGRERTLHLSESFYRQQSEAESLRLLQARRLVLVLDIDHTLLHATPLSYVSESISSISSLGVPAASAATENQPNSLKYKTRVSASSTAMQEVDPRLQLLMASMHDTYGFTIMDEREVNYIRLRPGVRQFLEKVAPYFDIYIHTKGVREYAEKIMAVLDPDRRLFKSALCRDDVSLDHKSLSHLLPCPSAQVLIVDDTVGVWVPPRGDTSATADIHEHVVWVPRYEYWSFFKSAMVSTEIDPPAMPEADLEPVVATAETASISDASSVTMPSRGRFRIPKRAAPVDPPASSAVVAGSFNSPQAVQTALQSRVPAVSMRRIKQIGGLMDAAEVADNVLHSVSEVLLAAHRLFFDNVDADLLTHPRRTECLPNTRYLLDSMRRSVLSGCVGLFSGVVPRDVDARRVHEYQVSQQLGLSVTDKLTSGVTHVIAAKDGSDKCRSAAKLAPNAKLVNVNWLHHSAAHFLRADESMFELTPHAELDYLVDQRKLALAALTAEDRSDARKMKSVPKLPRGCDDSGRLVSLVLQTVNHTPTPTTADVLYAKVRDDVSLHFALRRSTESNRQTAVAAPAAAGEQLHHMTNQELAAMVDSWGDEDADVQNEPVVAKTTSTSDRRVMFADDGDEPEAGGDLPEDDALEVESAAQDEQAVGSSLLDRSGDDQEGDIDFDGIDDVDGDVEESDQSDVDGADDWMEGSGAGACDDDFDGDDGGGGAGFSSSDSYYDVETRRRPVQTNALLQLQYPKRAVQPTSQDQAARKRKLDGASENGVDKRSKS